MLEWDARRARSSGERAAGFGPAGRGFNSLRARQPKCRRDAGFRPRPFSRLSGQRPNLLTARSGGAFDACGLLEKTGIRGQGRIPPRANQGAEAAGRHRGAGSVRGGAGGGGPLLGEDVAVRERGGFRAGGGGGRFPARGTRQRFTMTASCVLNTGKAFVTWCCRCAGMYSAPSAPATAGWLEGPVANADIRSWRR